MLPLHPKIVHFPVALLMCAALFGILALVFKSKRELFKEILFWNLALGVAGAAFAVLTGLLEERSLVHNDIIHSIMETHKLLGFIFTGIFLVLLIWMTLRKSKMKAGEFRVFIAVMILSAGLLGYSAHLGGKMVYGEGAGVVPMEKVINQKEHSLQDNENEDETHGHDTIPNKEHDHH